ncbi:hypothetical protein CVIRNUC_011223 [Coccomyxa viridis]|uniref:MPN domain-containing protein n=1 Tax=Coccomyxa viridis TaxID=1274662 RepID=A0AAV1IMX9_9CHLO|nr:hypothetical protein CVIRNUC_011223 [Coccomyxa viridis]
MPAVNGLPRSTSSRYKSQIIPVNNIIGLDKYYRSAHLLLRQADEYRHVEDNYQLYTMLMRFASLVLETIPRHAKFSGQPPEHMRLKRLLLETYMPELERLKMDQNLLMEQQQAPVHQKDTVRITTSNLPELSNWGVPTPAPMAKPRPEDDLSRLSLASSGDLLSDAMPISSGTATAPAQPAAQELPSWAQTNFSLPMASEAARSRHALLPTMSSARRVTPASTASMGPLYPSFDSSPIAPIDYGPAHAAQQQAQQQALPPPPSAPPMPQHAYSQQHAQHPASLLDADAAPQPLLDPQHLLQQLQPSPQLELQLGPQEVQVQHLPPPQRAPEPGEVCSHDNAVEVVPPLGTDQPGAPAPEKRGIRDVQVSMALMDEFLKYAASNTRRGVESCGILAGVLDEKNACFQICTLIIPKQEGTSDTVQALNEEEIFDVQDKRSLYPLGWIHTHPTQTCFLSSVDVHTQCGYQTMLEEAVAIVMAPRDSRKRCGLFRLSTPGGLQLVQKCPERGFHAHQATKTGQPLYELCGHMYLNPRVQHDVVDLR